MTLVAVGAVALVVCFSATLVTAPTASALVGTPIATAAQDVANGTATQAETDEVQAAIDYIYSEFGGVGTSAVPYPSIEGSTWTQSASGAALEQAGSSVTSGGATEAAVAAEGLDGAGVLGVTEALGAAVPVLGAGAAVAVCTFTNFCSKVVDDIFGGQTSNIATQFDEFPGIYTAERLWIPFCKGSSQCGTTEPACTLDPSLFDAGAGNGQSEHVLIGGTQYSLAGPGFNYGSSLPQPLTIPGCNSAMTQDGGVYVVEYLPENSTGVIQGNTFYSGGEFQDAASPLLNGQASGVCSPNPGAFGWWSPPPGKQATSVSTVTQHGIFNYGSSQNRSCNAGDGSTAYVGDDRIVFEPGSAMKATWPHPGGCPGGYTCTALPQPHAGCSTAQCLANLFSGTGFNDLGQFIDAALGNGTNGQPTQMPGLVQVPNCVGVQPSACRSLLTGAGIVTAPQETTLTPAQADLTKPAGAVVSTNPASGAWVDPDTGVVTLTENPNPLPIVVPQPLQGGETYTQYLTRLQGEGFVGSYTNEFVTDANINPQLGPDDVVAVSPAPGTQIAPNTSVTVQSNPDDAPAPQPGGGPPGAPTLPGISIGGAPTPCTVFPFGIPCWIGNQLSEFVSTTPQAPSFSIGTPSLLGGGNLNVNLDHPFGADLSSVMAICRVVLLVVSFLGLIYWLAGFALGGSTGGGGGAEESEA